jgi:NTP pyrophosphatase (non-canonical NTP hydrolase)
MSEEMNPWHPMSDPVDLKHMGKLCEETGELTQVVARCIIQGIDTCDPVTQKLNRDWIEDEVADVLANIELVRDRFKLDKEKIAVRAAKKKAQLKIWHDMA